MQLSKNFSLAELVESQTARRHGYDEQFMPPAKVVDNLQALVTNILQPLRDAVGPINVSSGYRSIRTNAAVKGARNSQHTIGEAADISGASNAEIFRKIQELDLPFDQLIWEYGTKRSPAWVHVSYGPRNRRQVLYIPKNLQP